MTDAKTCSISSELAGLDATATLKNNGVVADIQHDHDIDDGNKCEVVSSSSISPLSFVVKTHRPYSKLILQNMEEVLSSVKKKHRQKHRRKKEQKKLAAQMEADATAEGTAAVTNTNIEKPDKTKKKHNHHHHHHHHHHHRKSSALEEKCIETNGNVQQHAKKVKTNEKQTTTNSILKHFPTTSTNKGHEEEEAPEEVEGDALSVIVVEEEKEKLPSATQSPMKPTTKATNAFEVLMNARNKSIGSNTPGKEPPAAPITDGAATSAAAKRKLLLQDWAEKKGGAKRKLEDESRAAYIEKELSNRAKRLKRMLVNGTTKPKSTDLITSAAAVATPPASPTQSPAAEPVSQKVTRKRRKSLKTAKSITGKYHHEVHDTKETPVVSVDQETEEFLAKLSSPTKKRDSLLGYFPKKPSPKTVVTNNIVSTTPPQSNDVKKPLQIEDTSTRSSSSSSSAKTMRKSTSRVKRTTKATEAIGESLQNTPTSTSIDNVPSGRPRRSCAGKARYDYDLEKSPTKTLQTAMKSDDDDDDVDDIEIINLDDNSKTPQKLAPLFVRSIPKPSPNPEVLKARQAFLHSGVPEILRMEQAKQKQYEQTYEEAIELFPKISHVCQLSEDEAQYLQQPATHKGRRNILIKPLEQFANEEDTITTITTSRRKSKGKQQRTAISLPRNTTTKSKQHCTTLRQQHLPLANIANKREIIKKWKTDFQHFPAYKCYNQMREKYRFFSSINSAQDTEQVTESFVVTRRRQRNTNSTNSSAGGGNDTIIEIDEVKPPATAPNGELLFIEKYKPILFEQVLVNLNSVIQLRDFLSNWSNASAGSVRNSQTYNDGADDGFDFVNDSSSSQPITCSNTVVLLGPTASGKTSAVYALANDMNFNVLEVNAGMKRTGKKLIQELQEATQSHQIRKDPSGGSKLSKNILKMSLGSAKSKKSKTAGGADEATDASCSPTTIEQNQNARMSLILIEDADVVFDQTDAGFIDALYTLAASSKRPVIIVASNPNCQHLQRLMNQNMINFHAPYVLNMSKYMAVLSLIENCPVQLDDLISLYLYNHKDTRKTLMELQFFIQSGGDGPNRKDEMTTTTTTMASSSDATIKKAEAGGQAKQQYFASPSKRRFSEDPIVKQQQQQEPDELLSKDGRIEHGAGKIGNNVEDVYMHRTLFEFYTMNQNEPTHRIPFPVDFHLLRLNLNDVFKVSHSLVDAAVIEIDSLSNNSAKARRKSRSPKKSWPSTAAKKSHNTPKHTSNDVLCDFYENASIAALLSARSAAGSDSFTTDRLMPHLAEDIAHTLIENAIEVNLDADKCAYNLFDTPKERYAIGKCLTMPQLRSERTCLLDLEPTLRAICRCEKLRSMQERRSTRFYHYLRNITSMNIDELSHDLIDGACRTFIEPPPTTSSST